MFRFPLLLDGGVQVKFIYSEKAPKFCEIFPLLLTVCTVVKSKGKISQDFVAFSECMNFKYCMAQPSFSLANVFMDTQANYVAVKNLI